MQASETIWDERSALERLTRILPGFRGYQLRDHRRETDALLCGFALHRLDQVRARVEQTQSQVEARERAPYRGIARRLARLCEDLAMRGPLGSVEPSGAAAAKALDALYAQEEDVVRAVVSLSVAVHERGTRPEDLVRELDRVERGLARRRELLVSLLG